MELLSVLLVSLSLLLGFIIHFLIRVWRQHKKLEMVPSKKPNPIFGHTWLFLGPRN
ncbi:hypothetical protein L9F63_027353, partial [Diploptera punctata]